MALFLYPEGMPRVKRTKSVFHGSPNRFGEIKSIDYQGIWATSQKAEAEGWALRGGSSAWFKRGGVQKYKVGYVHELDAAPFFDRMRREVQWKNPSALMRGHDGGNFDLPGTRGWKRMGIPAYEPPPMRPRGGYWVRKTRITGRTARTSHQPFQAFYRDKDAKLFSAMAGYARANPGRTALKVGAVAAAAGGGYYYYRRHKSGKRVRVRKGRRRAKA